jgi:iron complex outermembrane recepter protein
LCLCLLSVLALSVVSVRAGAAEAPQADADASAAPASLSEVVVTGSRITAAGFTQPTPTTMLSAPDIEKVAEPNLFDAIAELPALQGSTGRTTFANSTSSGMQGLSSFSLRNLGTIRTLTLLDGQRVTPANVTGVADVSQFPQLLMKRVDIVTGGASASYGSDAIGGVVNFVTDKKFVGFKANLEAGETTYQDDKNITAQAAWGSAFLNDRLHVEASGEYSKEGGVPSGGFGVGSGAGGRNWFTAPAFQVRPISQTTDGKPQYIVIQDAQQYQYAKYGLITNGPLQGTAFGVGGAPHQFQYGSNGVPTGTGSVTNCFSPFCVGGDLSGDVNQSTSLAARLQRTVGYTRLGYDLDANNEVYVTANVARVTSTNQPNAGAEKTANLTIHCDNPYLPASIQAQCATDYPASSANTLPGFGFGTSNGEFGAVDVNAERQMLRFVAGADGAGDLFGTKWSYNGYYAHGTNRTDIDVQSISLTPRYNAAIDAITGPNGTVVCRSAAARASGCVPLNVIGQVAVDPAALGYVLPANGPQQRSRQEEHVVSFNVSGEPFSLWAGPVAVATGLEYRNESYTTRADPYGNGVTADSPYSAAYPADPVLSASGNNWYAGNFHDGQGSYHVAEAYVEQNIPFLKWEPLGEANLNLAVRQTKYSTSGNVTAWKVGGTWKTPIDALSFRAVTSRDIRAPNLSELFSPTVVTNSTVIANGKNITVLGETVGNSNLKPEIARNTTFGIVLSQPEFLPGFSASIDYYDIRLTNEVSTLTAQNEVDLCAAGNQQLCSQMLLTSTVPNTNYVRVQAFNLAKVRDEGYDIEAMYRTGLAAMRLPGSFTVRALATRTISFLTDSGIIGTIPVQSAGVNQGNGVTSFGIPFWKTYFTQGWDNEKYSLTLTERWFSDGVYARENIQCQTNCPVSTVVHPTINNNVMKGATYVDLGGTYQVSNGVTAYFKVDNLVNKSPVPAPQTSVYYGANPYLYDVLGRMYRVGVRMSF